MGGLIEENTMCAMHILEWLYISQWILHSNKENQCIHVSPEMNELKEKKKPECSSPTVQSNDCCSFLYVAMIPIDWKNVANVKLK